MSATGRGRRRDSRDRYATPEWCVKGLLACIDWKRVKTFCDPCMGAFERPIYDLVPLPQERKWWREIDLGKDYFELPPPPQVDLIIANPPYGQAIEFLKRSFEHSNTVIYLLRINFLGSQDRVSFWRSHEPTHMLILTPRPSFTNDGGADATDYAWFCWDYGDLVMGPMFQWIEKTEVGLGIHEVWKR